MYEQYIEDELEELGIEAELEDTEIYQPGYESGEPEFETQQITKIVPHLPGEGLRQNLVHNYVTPNGNQFSVTVKERPQCPSCDYVLAGETSRNILRGVVKKAVRTGPVPLVNPSVMPVRTRCVTSTAMGMV